MPKRKAAPVDQLRILNELLGRVSDPQRAEHARRALEFAFTEHPQDLEERGNILEERQSTAKNGRGATAMATATFWRNAQVLQKIVWRNIAPFRVGKIFESWRGLV